MTFGGLRWSHHHEQISIDQSHATASIFTKLILVHDRARPRDVIAEAIWPETSQEKSRSNLNSALWRLKKDLNQRKLDEFVYVEGDKEYLQIKFANGVSTDFDDLCLELTRCEHQSLKEGGIDDTQLARLQDAVARYKDEFVPGLDFDWAIAARERFRMRYIQACNILMDAFEKRNDFESTIKYGQKILEQDNLRETMHHRLIETYVKQGLRHQAIRQYQLVKRILNEELGLLPQEQTTALIEAL